MPMPPAWPPSIGTPSAAPRSTRPIEGVTEQTEQTFAFLEAVAAYNRAIAEYATTVLPPGTPPNKLAAALRDKTLES